MYLVMTGILECDELRVWRKAERVVWGKYVFTLGSQVYVTKIHGNHHIWVKF